MPTATPSFVHVEKLGLKTGQGHVYENLSFSAEKGQVVCLFGVQGSGKTAMLLSICGRMKFTSGEAKVAGWDVHRNFRRVRRISQISLIPGLNDVQPFLSLGNIVAAELALVGKHGDRAATDAYMKEWGFYDKRKMRFEDLHAYDVELFGIMLAMTGDPELLVVDDVHTELTQHQSIEIVCYLKELARKHDMAVLVACSEFDIANHADGLVIVDEHARDMRAAVLRDKPDTVPVPIIGYANNVDTGAAHITRSDLRAQKAGA